MKPRVAVVGGGYAGFAAAVTLANQGIQVTVFESAKQIGGRARAMQHAGLTLDSGQHILLGAYRETLRLIEMVDGNGAQTLLRLPLMLAIPGRFKLRVAALPAPLHLVFGLLAAQGLSLAERLSALRFMLKMRQQNFRIAADMPVSELLQQHGQSRNIAQIMWEPLCTAALNTPPGISSAQVFLNVLRDSLNGTRSDSDMLLPRVDLSTIFPERAATYLQARGSEVRLSQKVENLTMENGRISVGTAGTREQFSHVICAVPPQRLASLIAPLPQLAQTSALLEKFEYQPIYTIYLQYPSGVKLPEAMLGMLGRHIQWLFDRGQISGHAGLIAAVISADGAHQELTHEALAQTAHLELSKVLGALPPPLWHQVIAEKRATFACTVNLERPSQKTAIGNLFLAGDYTASDYPATLEAAAQSGVKCAQFILETLS